MNSLISITQAILLVKYAIYTIWIIPAYRISSVLKNWRKARAKVLRPRVQLACNPRVAVVIPARNASRFIREVLESVLKQTIKPKHIVVVDDCSTDNTFSTICRYARSLGGRVEVVGVKENHCYIKYRVYGNQSIIVVRLKKHSGKPAAVNKALEMLDGLTDYVLILDADTKLEENYIEKLYKILIENPEAAAASGLPLLWREEPRGRWSWLVANALRNLTALVYALTIKTSESVKGVLNGVSGCATLFRYKELREAGGLPTDTPADDTGVTWRLSIMGYKLIFTPYAHSYTIDPGSLLYLLKRFYRILVGSNIVFFRNAREALRRGRVGLVLTGFYSCIGSLPFILSLMNLAVTMFLARIGVFHYGLLEYAAFILQFSSIGVILSIISRYPLLLLAVSYSAAIIELFLMSLFLKKVYRDDEVIKKAINQGIKSLPVGPLILWIQALSSLAALAVAGFKAIVKGRVSSKW